MAVNLADTFIREAEINTNSAEKCLKIYQLKTGDVGCVVWDAALVLAHFVSTKKCTQKYIEGKRLIELGSGTGVVGMAARICGAQSVVLTDLNEFVPLMKLNITKNFAEDSDSGISSMALDWLKTEDAINVCMKHSGFDCILIADCVYYDAAVEPLVNTISTIFDQSGPDTVAICCYEERDIGNKEELQKLFKSLLEERKFQINFVPLSEMHSIFQSEDIHIMIISK